MEALRRAAEQAEAGHGQVVSAVAEPGVGKSRLFFEFKAKNQSGWMVLDAFCQISCEIPPVVSFETPPFPVIPFVWLGEREGATPPRHSA